MLWWIVATICAFFIKGLCGFANTLVFTTILNFGNNNVNISPVELILGYPTNIILAWKERKSIKWEVCVPLAALVIIGSIPGVLFLKNADTSFVKILFDIVIVLISLEMLLREFQTKKAKQSKVILGIIGILSGLLCGLYGIGALLLIPFMLIGLVLGMLSGKILDEKIVSLHGKSWNRKKEYIALSGWILLWIGLRVKIWWLCLQRHQEPDHIGWTRIIQKC